MGRTSGWQCWWILPPVPWNSASLIAPIYAGTTIHPVAVIDGNPEVRPATLGPAAPVDAGAPVQKVPPLEDAPPVPGMAYGGWHLA